ncbi:MAG: PUA domain-containing protein, partial [Nitriliruptoraceae bacterium]
RIHVDAGAADALRTRGVSLLGVGVSRADGSFAAGDAVEVVDPDGRTIGRGLSNYDVADVARIAGRSTTEAAATFGAAYAREVIHRDQLVVLGSGR